MAINLDIAKEVYECSESITSWESVLLQLEAGLSVIQDTSSLHTKSLEEMRAANIALAYYRELMLHHLVN